MMYRNTEALAQHKTAVRVVRTWEAEAEHNAIVERVKVASA